MSGANMTAAFARIRPGSIRLPVRIECVASVGSRGARVEITVQVADGRFVSLEMNESTARFLAERLVAHANAIELAARMEAP